jgi:hypothetical protein
MEKRIVILFALFAIASLKPRLATAQKPAEGVNDTTSVIARWEADHPEKAQGLSLVHGKIAGWRIETLDGFSVASI